MKSGGVPGLMEEAFNSIFQQPPRFKVDVPARICVFGEHSDYVPYLNAKVVTFASSEQRMSALIRPRKDGFVKIASTLQGLENRHTKFSIRECKIEGDWLEALDSRGPPATHWSNYVKGAIAYLVNAQDVKNIDKGFDMLVDSNIPAASGASSSSALTLCGMVAACLANDLSWSNSEMAEAAGKAEWFVDTRGGVMDHATMCLAEEGAMLEMEFRPLSAVPIEDCRKWKWYSVFTHPAEKSGGVREAFNELAYVQQIVIPIHLETMGEFSDMSPEWVADVLPEFFEDLKLGRIRLRDRFNFVHNEYARVQAFISAMESADEDVLKNLLESSWNDTRTLLGTHTPEMEKVAEYYLKKEGVLGVKVLGAGFGGNLLICAKEGFDMGPDAIEHTPGAGLQLLELD